MSRGEERTCGAVFRISTAQRHVISALFVLSGMSAWLAINSFSGVMYGESFRTLGTHGHSIPAYLVLAVQLANVFPLLYNRFLFARGKHNLRRDILAILAVGTASIFALAVAWDVTAQGFAVGAFVLALVGGSMDALTTVTLYPFLRDGAWVRSYAVPLQVGESLSGTLPGALALLRQPDFRGETHFSIELYFTLLGVVGLVSLGAFVLLSRAVVDVEGGTERGGAGDEGGDAEEGGHVELLAAAGGGGGGGGGGVEPVRASAPAAAGPAQWLVFLRRDPLDFATYFVFGFTALGVWYSVFGYATLGYARSAWVGHNVGLIIKPLGTALAGHTSTRRAHVQIGVAVFIAWVAVVLVQSLRSPLVSPHAHGTYTTVVLLVIASAFATAYLHTKLLVVALRMSRRRAHVGRGGSLAYMHTFGCVVQLGAFCGGVVAWLLSEVWCAFAGDQGLMCG